MFLNSQPYKCEIFISFSEYPFLTPLQFHHGWLYSTIFSRQIFLSCRKNLKTLITLQGIGILQTKSGCNLDSSTLYYHLQNHLNIIDNSIAVSKSTTSLAITSPFLYNISIQEPHLLKKVLLLLQQKEISKYANIQKITPSIFISSAHKITLALIIIVLLMITILGLILLKIQKISKKNKQNTNTYRTYTENSFKLSDKTFTDRIDIQLLTFLFFHFLYTPFFLYRLTVTLGIFSDTGTFRP